MFFFKGVFKQVNPNNSVNIEIKGGSGAGGGSKKNGVPPSPAASKKVHKNISKKVHKNVSKKVQKKMPVNVHKYILNSFHMIHQS